MMVDAASRSPCILSWSAPGATGSAAYVRVLDRAINWTFARHRAPMSREQVELRPHRRLQGDAVHQERQGRAGAGADDCRLALPGIAMAAVEPVSSSSSAPVLRHLVVSTLDLLALVHLDVGFNRRAFGRQHMSSTRTYATPPVLRLNCADQEGCTAILGRPRLGAPR